MKLITQNENKPGYKETKIGWIPEEWCTKRLQELSTLFFSNVDKKSYGNEIPVKLCNYTDVYNNDSITNEIDFMIATASQREIDKYLLHEGDVIITKDSEDAYDIAVPTFVSENFKIVLCGYHLALIRPDRKKLIGEYLNHLFKLHSIRHYFSTLANGVTRYGLTTTSVNHAYLPIPPLHEQKKIASILSTWDKAIEKIDALIKAKEKLKKGLMQKLLTGKVRFKTFQPKDVNMQMTKFGEIPEDWNHVSINQISSQINVKNSDNNCYTVLSCTKHSGLVDSLKYFGRQIYSKNLSTYKVVKRNQFAYATNHIEEGSIGYQNLHDFSLISPMYTVFETNVNVNDQFLFALLKTELYRHIFEINTSASVNRRGSLRWHQFSKIKIPLPTIEEQQKIASVLSECDKEIDLFQKEKITLELQKKGLMQKLLTGTVRVELV